MVVKLGLDGLKSMTKESTDSKRKKKAKYSKAMKMIIILVLSQRLSSMTSQHISAEPRSPVGSASDTRARYPGSDTLSGHILSFLFPLIKRRAVVSYWRKYVH